MPDVKKVIEALEACVLKDPDDSRDCKHCPRCNYGAFITTSCINGVMADALALLKAQEPMEPKVVDTSNSKLYHNDMFKNHYCGNCGEFLHVVNRKDLFCSQCGRAVKWE